MHAVSDGTVKRVLLSWSGGKDSALALHRLRAGGQYEVAGLLTTVTSGYDRVSIHGVRRALLHAQAAALSLPLVEITIPPAASNAVYQAAWASALATLPPGLGDIRTLAFGDIFLEDVRAYRETMAAELGYGTVFPLWGGSSTVLADEIIDLGFAARLVCVDTQALPGDFAGRGYDQALVSGLPAGVDACGENGEFHTFVSAGPGFAAPVPFKVGETVLREGRFMYCDLVAPSA